MQYLLSGTVFGILAVLFHEPGMGLLHQGLWFYLVTGFSVLGFAGFVRSWASYT